MLRLKATAYVMFIIVYVIIMLNYVMTDVTATNTRY